MTTALDITDQLIAINCAEEKNQKLLFSSYSKLLMNNGAGELDSFEELEFKDQKTLDTIVQVYKDNKLDKQDVETLGGKFGVYFTIKIQDPSTIDNMKGYGLAGRECYTFNAKKLIYSTVKEILSADISTLNLIYFNEGWRHGTINHSTVKLEEIILFNENL
jgi:hypothetical protein